MSIRKYLIDEKRGSPHHMICETHSINIDIDYVKKFYAKLGDDLSRKIFDARLIYGITGDADGLIGNNPLNEERRIISVC